MNVIFDTEIDKLLKKFADEDHKTPDMLVKDIVAKVIEDRLDYMDAVAEDQLYKKEGGALTSLQDLGKELGLSGD